MATRKQLDQAREIRLWLLQVGVPIVTIGALIVTNPYVKAFARNAMANLKAKINQKFSKEEQG